MPHAVPAAHLPAEPIDLRLVVTDMDGTLLDAEGRIPERLWELLPRLRERGITLAPASGRQYPTLRGMFAEAADGMSFIAENGTLVVSGGAELSCTPLERRTATDLVHTVRELAEAGDDVGLVWGGRRAAYVERSDRTFLDRVAPYYAALEVVDDLLAAPEGAIKGAVFTFGDAETSIGPVLAERFAGQRVVVSSEHWVDVMDAAANKGAALESLQRELGVTPEQTVVFGDYLNDLEMLTGSPYSFAMANAHPEVIEAARFVAPTNAEHGVVRVLELLLDAPVPA